MVGPVWGPSCSGLAATCGPSKNDNCCTSLLVPGGAFNLSNDPTYPATVSDFYLDKYEVTVGRFRAFVTAYTGGWRPTDLDHQYGSLADGIAVRLQVSDVDEHSWGE